MALAVLESSAWASSDRVGIGVLAGGAVTGPVRGGPALTRSREG
jgi:hypothetical protein